MRITRVRWRLLRTLAIWLLANAASPAAAQLATGATAGVSSQASRDFAESSVGGVVFLDGAVSDRVAVSGEASLAVELEGRQHQDLPGAEINFQSRHRDSVFSGVVKIRMLDWQRLHVGPALGVGAGWRHTVRDGTLRLLSGSAKDQLVTETLSDVVLAATLGFDVGITFGPRAALVWTGRMHFLNDDDRDRNGVVRRGVASSIFRFGGGARIAF